MAVHLGPNQYGKAENRLVTVSREGSVHTLRDLTVSTSLRGELAATHLTGDNSGVVPTDTQKNTVYAFAKEAPVGEIEEFALRLGRHFVGSFDQITGARVLIEEHGWGRIAVNDHSFVRGSDEKRTTAVTIEHDQAWVVSGLRDLVVLKTTGSEFHGYPRDKYTTLPETNDRILATAVSAQWRFGALDVDWAKSFAEAREAMLAAFADTHSLSLQQTLYAMGEAVIETRPEIAEVRLSLPNRHHFVVDLGKFGLENNNEVFYAADRPYGLIEGTVLRDDAPEPGLAWHTLPAF
ncbi:factor-independent urate hydroxylase [Kutzneria sp. CA-103260]|uniref:factor-independent urate hydroxylase n=1 Tax=Kutzneria sp. CA-103260 TaxID=2802641 RepID=UPI001BAACCF4|nr:urate oxidase [Kutzneria sp. CA-103260]QUQ65043.1 urate oxidase [Kutzneria sp. CA-103260]